MTMIVLAINGNLQADLAAGGLASDEFLPSISAFADDLSGIPGNIAVSLVMEVK